MSQRYFFKISWVTFFMTQFEDCQKFPKIKKTRKREEKEKRKKIKSIPIIVLEGK